ncbi:MAG TPA: hypothetical protein VF493_14595 [Terriglobales bacterium]
MVSFYFSLAHGIAGGRNGGGILSGTSCVFGGRDGGTAIRVSGLVKLKMEANAEILRLALGSRCSLAQRSG